MNESKDLSERILEKASVVNHIALILLVFFEGISHTGDIYDLLCRNTSNPILHFLQLASYVIISIALFLILVIGMLQLYKRFSKSRIYPFLTKFENFIISRRFRIIAIPTISIALICAATFTVHNSLLDIRPWKLATSWPNASEGFPSIMREDLASFSREIYEASKHKIQIQWDSSAAENPKTLFQQLKNGDIQMLYSVHYFWPVDANSKSRAGDFFAAVPFGKEYEELNDWIENDEGQKLWDSVCMKLNVKPFAFGHTGKQYGGWFENPFTTESLSRLRMRIPELQGEVIKKLGAKTVMALPNEIKNFVEDDSLNAAEWISPYEDMVLRLHRISKLKYYYIEGWQEENTMFGLYINNDFYNRLDKDTKEILKQTIAKYNLKITSKFSARNEWAMSEIKKYRSDLQVVEKLPESLKDNLYQSWVTVLKEHTKNDVFFKRVFMSYATHHKKWIQKKGQFQRKNTKYDYSNLEILK